MFYLEKLALDPATQTFDIDRIETGLTTQTRNQFKIMMDIIENLSETMGKTIPLEDVIIEAVKHEIKEYEIEELIEVAKVHHLPGLAWIKVEKGNKLESSIVKYLPEKVQKDLIRLIDHLRMIL
mgnify:CR=1 FL=1